MNAAQAKKIPLTDILARLGHAPARRIGPELYYFSPFRDERTPSFSVNPERNYWFDHGQGTGGGVIEFALAYWKVTTVAEALKELSRLDGGLLGTPLAALLPDAPPAPKERQQSLFDPPTSPAGPSTTPERYGNDTEAEAGQEGEAMTVRRRHRLGHPALLQYLDRRGIPAELARRHLEEMHYTHHGKPYFALAFKNDSGGYELRNPYFQGCQGKKDITLIEPAGEGPDRYGNAVAVFEGFMDWLTALTLAALPEGAAVLVLNSASMKDKALAAIRERQPSAVHLYLDHDQTGRELVAAFTAQLPDLTVVDQSGRYAGYKDFNEHLQAQARTRQGTMALS